MHLYHTLSSANIHRQQEPMDAISIHQKQKDIQIRWGVTFAQALQKRAGFQPLQLDHIALPEPSCVGTCSINSAYAIKSNSVNRGHPARCLSSEPCQRHIDYVCIEPTSTS